MQYIATATLAILLSGCANKPAAAPLLPAVSVAATVETEPVGTPDDAADDPAIWRNAAMPSASLVVATDKKAGLHLFDLKGRRLDFTPSPRLNNVDLRDIGPQGVIIAASDRSDVTASKIALFRLDTQARKLLPLPSIPAGPGEAYGMCLWSRRSDGALFAFMILKDGRIDQIALDLSGAAFTGSVVRSMKLGTQSEGCVVDDQTGILYVAEEDVGIWKFSADPTGDTTPHSIAKADNKNLFIDVEGLALAKDEDGNGYLVASSQGDNAYALYALNSEAFVGRFRVGDAGGIDGVQETDGIEIALGNFGPDFPNGIMVVQDGDNLPSPQNFKFIDWRRVMAALAIK